MAIKGDRTNSLANLKKGNGHLATNPSEYGIKSGEVRRRRGMIRRAALEALETGQVVVNSKDVELFDHEGNKLNIEFTTAKLKVPNYMAIGMALMKEAKGGDTKAIEILIKLDENFENRKIKLQQKDTKIKEELATHLQKIKIVNPIEIGEETPYEELDRSIE